MKSIKIFLASSIIEFKQEREKFGNFIRRLNRIYVNRNIRFDLFLCEDVLKEIHNRRMQEYYNDEIRKSRYFCIIVGKNLGGRSLEEFDVALSNFMSKGFPRIVTYFYTALDGETKAQSVLDFMRHLENELGQDYDEFEHFDSIKLDFLMRMQQDPELQGNIVFKDGSAVLDGEEIMPLKNVPIYGKNKSLTAMKAQKEKLDKQFADTVARYTANPEDNTLYLELTEVSEERTRIADAVRSAEKEILSLCMDISKLRVEKGERTWREKEAILLTNQGNYEAALTILRDEERKKELKHAVNVMESNLAMVAGYIQENLLRIKTLKAQGLDEQKIAEIDKCYEEVVEMSIKYNVERETIYAYASFLYSQHEYQRGIEMAQRLCGLYASSKSEYDAAEARLHLLLGELYYQSYCYPEAISSYRLVEEFFRRTPKGNEEEQIRLYNNMADYYWRKHHSKAAKDSLEKAMALLESQPDLDNSKGLRERAHIYERLATLANREWQLDQAELYHRRALNIQEALFRKNPLDDDLLSELAMTYNNLGIVYRRMKRYDDADVIFKKSYTLRQPKYETNRPKFALGYAITCNNYGFMLAYVGRLEEAERLSTEIERPIKKRLMECFPQTYKATYAVSLYTYGLILSKYDDPKKLEQAEEQLKQSMELLKELIEAGHDHYTFTLADSYYVYIQLLKKMGRFEEAEYYCRRNLEIYLEWDQRDSGYYEHEISVSAFDLADVLSRREGAKEEAQRMYRKSLECGRRVMEKSAEYYWEEYIAAIKGLLALLINDESSQEEMESLNKELAFWEQKKEG